MPNILIGARDINIVLAAPKVLMCLYEFSTAVLESDELAGKWIRSFCCCIVIIIYF